MGTVLRVIAFKAGMNDSGVNSGTYYYNPDNGTGANDSGINSGDMQNPGDGGPGGGGVVIDGGGQPTINYDDNGNLIHYKEWNYRYDAQNRLTEAWNGATTAKFYYDGKNRQIARNINGVIRFNSWDGWDLLEEYSSNLDVATAYLQGSTGVIKSWSAANTIYYYQDKLGSTTHVANASGQLVESYHYDLTGKSTETSTHGVVDLYAGERWIPELALYDLRNRFMSPELGRFLQPDPIGFQGDASNLYRYCGNDPVDRSDPTGLYEVNASADIWSRLRGFDSSFAGQTSLHDENVTKSSNVAQQEALKQMRAAIKGKEDSTAKIFQRGNGPIHAESSAGQKVRSDPNYLLSLKTRVHEGVTIRIGDKIYYLVHVHTRSGENQNTLNDQDKGVLRETNRPMYFTTRDWVTNHRVDLDRASMPGNYVIFQPNGAYRAYNDPQLVLPPH
jgi:RHS repeat-associated protein